MALGTRYISSVLLLVLLVLGSTTADNVRTRTPGTPKRKKGNFKEKKKIIK
jgi:hypothetical protein